MVYLITLAVYLIGRFYISNMLLILFYLNILLIGLFTLILCIAGMASAVPFGVYSFLLFIFMFIEASVSFFKK